jgi:DnaJ-class molecular chaperone
MVSNRYRAYPNGDYEVACPKCKGAGLMPGSSFTYPVKCTQCKGMGLVLVRHSDHKIAAFDNAMRCKVKVND